MYSGTSVALPRQDLAGAMKTTLLSSVRYAFPKVFPILPVEKDSGVIYNRALARELLNHSVARASDGGYPRSQAELESTTYQTIEYGQEGWIDDKKRKRYQNQFDLEAWEVERLMHVIWRPQEARVSAILNNNTNLPNSGNTGYNESNTWGSSSGTPLTTANLARAGMRARGAPDPNTLILPDNVYDNLGLCPQIIDRIKAISGVVTQGVLPEAAVAEAFGVKQVIRTNARYNSASEGLTASISSIWTATEAIFCYVPETEDPEEPCVGRTLVWSEDGAELTVEMYREENRRGDIVRVRQNTSEKLLQTACAYRVTAVA